MRILVITMFLTMMIKMCRSRSRRQWGEIYVCVSISSRSACLCISLREWLEIGKRFQNMQILKPSQGSSHNALLLFFPWL